MNNNYFYLLQGGSVTADADLFALSCWQNNIFFFYLT